MQITRTDVDALNAKVAISIEQVDFTTKVETILKDYKKNANVPGFRKGHVPMGMIKKQYETAVMAEEVNKLLQESLTNYIQEEKLELLGNPLPVMQDEIDWKADQLSFEFELGFAPNVDVNIKGKKAITQFQIEADKKMIDEQLNYLQKQYGKLEAQSSIDEGFELTLSIINEEAAINTTPTIEFDQFKGKKNKDALKAAKLNEAITVKTKGLFTEDHITARALGVTADALADIPAEVSLTVTEANKRILAELDQELFDKLYEPGTVKNVTELKAKIKEGIEKQFVQQTDQKLLNDVTESLIDATKFDLPKEFLIRWLQNSGEQPLTEEEAIEEYNKSEKGIRYQLIEGSLIKNHDLQVKFEELQSFAKDMIKQQMAQYGQLNPADKELDDIAARIFSNQEETKRLSDQLMSQKLLEFYKENANLKLKKVNYEAFVKEAYDSAK
ncbi:trigger factor [Flavobacteriaceae bacterium]|nr:trigger factor [Flavobacteriaceae bacterium]MDC1060832.1 trigger factor [Flavobacteriaceae bacterium]